MKNKFNKIIDFDNKKYPFQSLIMKTVSDYLDTELNDLTKLHEHLRHDELKPLTYQIFRYFRSDEFLYYYHDFCSSIIADHFNGKADYQAVPSLRIQYPDVKTVNFHNDMMYGHGADIVNVWVPLVRVHESNSMYVVNESESKMIFESFNERQWSIIELNEACESKAKTLNMTFGQYFIFYTWVLHGTLQNRLDETRVSFDIRFLPEGGDFGLKDRSFFLSTHKKDVSKTINNTAIYMHNYIGYTNNISTRYQSILCQRYCENNNLSNIIVEETEIRTVNHQPNLYDLCFGTGKDQFNAIVMISLLLLPKEKKKRKEFLKSANSHGIELHFVLDDYVFNRKQSVSEVMRFYDKVSFL